MLNISPKELDAQSPIKIDRFVEIGSEEHRYLDDNVEFTKTCLKGLKDAPDSPAFLSLDRDGRVWSAKPNEDGKYYPLHFEHGKRLIGYRNSKFAAN